MSVEYHTQDGERLYTIEQLMDAVYRTLFVSESGGADEMLRLMWVEVADGA